MFSTISFGGLDVVMGLKRRDLFACPRRFVGNSVFDDWVWVDKEFRQSGDINAKQNLGWYVGFGKVVERSRLFSSLGHAYRQAHGEKLTIGCDYNVYS